MCKSVTAVALLWLGIYYDLHIENIEEIKMKKELKPCPFCGAEPMYYKSFSKVTIGCRSADCHVNPTFSVGKRENPEDKWNKRND
jgi:hypothetical protein